MQVANPMIKPAKSFNKVDPKIYNKNYTKATCNRSSYKIYYSYKIFELRPSIFYFWEY